MSSLLNKLQATLTFEEYKKKYLKDNKMDLKNLGISNSNIEPLIQSEYADYLKKHLHIKNSNSNSNSNSNNNSDAPNNSEGLFSTMTDEERKALEDIKELNTIINAWFSELYKDEEKATRSTGKLARHFPEKCPGDAICAWDTMKSSGNASDCIIHSFLTATCPNFRRLPGKYKDKFAHRFRVELYPTFSLTEKMLRGPRKEAHHARIFGRNFLEDRDLSILSRTYKINFLMFESEKEEGDEKMPATATLFATFAGPVYLLSNSDNVHYESVRTSDGSYSISKEEATAISKRLEPKQLANKTNKVCAYEVGDDVIYEGKKYIVFQRKYDPDTFRCIELFLTDERGYKEYDTGDEKTRDSSEEVAKILKHKVSPDRVKPYVGGSGGGRQTRRKRGSMRRKTRRV